MTVSVAPQANAATTHDEAERNLVMHAGACRVYLLDLVCLTCAQLDRLAEKAGR
jgi:hypothetical protein